MNSGSAIRQAKSGSCTLKKGDAIYLVHAFRKKTQTMPRRELDIIHKRLKET